MVDPNEGYCCQRAGCLAGWWLAQVALRKGSLDVRWSENRDQGVHEFAYAGHPC